MIADEKRRSDSELGTGVIESRIALEPHIPTGKEILEVGCGNGYLSALILEKNNRLTAIDISANAIGACRKKFKNAGEFIQANILDFNPEKRFDFVFLNEVLDQIPEDLRALCAVHRLLKPDGLLVLTTPVSKNRFIEASVHFYSETEIRQKVLEAGFEIKKTARYGGALSYVAAFLSRIFRF